MSITPISIRIAEDGHAVIEQSTGSATFESAEQILNVIEQLHECYDYCAAWRQPAQDNAATLIETRT